MSTTRLKSVKLPSGASVVLRPLRAEELNLVVNMATNSGKRVSTERYESLLRVLQNCTVSVENPGPFTDFTWAKTGDGDQFAGLFALRALTFGNTYPVTRECDDCGATFTANPSFLSTEDGGDLRVFAMHTDACAALGQPMPHLPPFTLPSGATVVCRIIAGPARKEATKIVEELKSDPFIASLRSRIVTMTDADGGAVEPNDLTRAVRQMEATDLQAMQDYLTEMDGGIDDYFPLACTSCGHVNEEATAPFVFQADFWGIPRKRRSQR